MNDNRVRKPAPLPSCPVAQLEAAAGELHELTCQLRLYLLQRHRLSTADLDRVSADMTKAFELGDRMELV